VADESMKKATRGITQNAKGEIKAWLKQFP
jgi:hypothetical protein